MHRASNFVEFFESEAITSAEETAKLAIRYYEIVGGPKPRVIRINSMLLNNETRQWMNAEIGYMDKNGGYVPLKRDVITPLKPLALNYDPVVLARRLYFRIWDCLNTEVIYFWASYEVLD